MVSRASDDDYYTAKKSHVVPRVKNQATVMQMKLMEVATLVVRYIDLIAAGGGDGAGRGGNSSKLGEKIICPSEVPGSQLVAELVKVGCKISQWLLLNWTMCCDLAELVRSREH